MDPKKWLSKDPLFGSVQCIYCGGMGETSDHTPPRVLLPREPPVGLQFMTVPACRACNAGFSNDEARAAAIIATVSFTDYDRHATAVGGWLYSAKEHDHTLARFIDERIGTDGVFQVDETVLEVLVRVFTKTAIGLIFFEFGRIVPGDRLRLLGLEHTRNILPDALVEQFRRADGGWPEVTPSGRELERYVMALEGLSPRHITRWKRYLPEFFEFKFIKRSDHSLLCAMNFHDALTALFECPWPSDAGPRRRGKPSRRGKPKN